MSPLRRSPAAGCFLSLIALSTVSRAAAQGTPKAEDLLARQLAQVERATAVYRDVEAARRGGYAKPRFGMDAPLMGEHWVNRELLAGQVDLARPAVLQYVVVGDRRVLVGVTYGHWQAPGAAMPEGFAGHDDHWHTHDLESMVRRFAERRSGLVRWAANQSVDAGRWRGPDGRTELAMLHVWLYSENPEGIFSNYNPSLPYLRAGLPVTWARSGERAAARGIELLRPESCGDAVRRFAWVVRADRSQRETLSRSCGEAADDIRQARTRGLASDSLNLAAASAWRTLAQEALAALTPDQRATAGNLGASGMGRESHEH
jgi:hypothetical protein